MERVPNRRKARQHRTRYSHNVEVAPRVHAAIDVLGERMNMNNTDVVAELLASYLHDRPMLAAAVLAELIPAEKAAPPRIEWPQVGVPAGRMEVRRG
jgi:hypothetical protein